MNVGQVEVNIHNEDGQCLYARISRRRTAAVSEPKVGATMRKTDADNPSVKSAERTVKILEALAGSPQRLSLAQLQERMGYPRSSLHALLRTLRELKWVETDETGSHFGVGPHALLSGTAYLDRDPALPYARETIEDLRAEIGYTVGTERV